MNEEDYKKRFDELADPDILEKIVSCYGSKLLGKKIISNYYGVRVFQKTYQKKSDHQ